MGDKRSLFSAGFNGSVHVEARGERLTSDSGAVLLRQTIDQLGLISDLTARLTDPRDAALCTHSLAELLRSSLLLLCLGWRDQDDADTLRDDGALRLAVSDRKGIAPLVRREREPDQALPKNPAVPDGLASQPTHSRLVRALSSAHNRTVLREQLLTLAAKRFRALRGGHRQRYLTIDIDSLPIEVEGVQEGSEYNGHYHARVYHPLLASVGQTGDLIDARLRAGNAHTAEGALDFILPLLERVERELCQVAAVRIDAGFPEEGLLSGLEQRQTPYVARVKNNARLDQLAGPYLSLPPGRPPAEPRTWFHELSYQAAKWSRARRAVLVVQEEPGNLFVNWFWLLTNWSCEQMSGEQLLAEYRQRGTAEGHMGELMNVLEPALSSTTRRKSSYAGKEPVRRYEPGKPFEINEAVLLLNLLAYGVMHAVRVVAEQVTGEGWSLLRLRERVLRVAGRILVHARRAVLVIAESAAPLWRMLWPAMKKLAPAS